MFEVGALGGLNNAGESATAGAENPGAGQSPEGGAAGPREAGLEAVQERGKERSERSGTAGSPWRFRSLNNSSFRCAICYGSVCV